VGGSACASSSTIHTNHSSLQIIAARSRCLSAIHTPVLQSQQLAQELTQKLPAAALAGLMATLSAASPAMAVDFAPAPEANTVVAEQQQAPSSFTFQGATQVSRQEIGRSCVDLLRAAALHCVAVWVLYGGLKLRNKAHPMRPLLVDILPAPHLCCMLAPTHHLSCSTHPVSRLFPCCCTHPLLPANTERPCCA
jgi:hypothetical protein